MANSTTHFLDYPIANARFSLPLSFRTSAGTPTDPTSPDTEYSTNGGATFADCAEEVTTGGGNGMGYLTLTGAETNNVMVLVASKSSNCLTTPAALQPRFLPIVSSGTLSAGSSTGGTLGTVLGYDVTGCYVRTTGGTGGGGTGGANNQARRILTYNQSTGAFTCNAWETTPDATTTYDVLLPEGTQFAALKALNPTTAGRTLDVTATGGAGIDWSNVENPTTSLNLSGTTIATSQVVASVTGAVGSVTGNVGGNVVGSVGSISGVTFPTNFSALAITASTGRVDLGLWLGTAPLSLSSQQVQAVVPSSTVVASVTGAVGSVTGNVGGNVTGSVGGLTGSVSVSSLAVSGTFTVGGATTWTGAVTFTNGLTSNVTGSITGNLSGSVGSVTGAVGSVTGAVGSVTGNVGGNVVGSVASVSGAVGSVAGGVGGDVGGKVLGGGSGTISGDGVRASGVTGDVGGNVVGSVGSVAGGVGGNVAGSVGSVTGAVGSVTGNVGGNVVGTVASVVSVSNIAAAVWAFVAESTFTAVEILRGLAAFAMGEASGGGTSAVKFRDLADTKDRIDMTVDASGNRTAVSRDLS